MSCRPLFLRRSLIALPFLLAPAGCGNLLALPDANANQNDNASSGPGAPSAQQVLVRFINRTSDEAVDVQFYATNDPLANLPDDLYAEAYRVTMSVGVAGSSLVTPGAGDQILIDCTDNITLGTAGGAFRQAESGEPRGVGQPRWAQNTGLGLCGGTVTFFYSGGGSTFETRITVE